VKLLLDTVALYRAATAPDELSPIARAALADDKNQLVVSAVSAWELAIKSSLGRLALPCPVDEFFAQTARDLLAESTTLELRFVAAVARLPGHHRDPFDRLLIAQALADDLGVVTSDPHFAAYGVRVLW
jgi:PIN domain nuclease of toxin-antitoxin system